jgi:hypothetical protein
MMNKDTHLLFEAYRKVNEAFEYFGNSSKGENNESHSEDECGKGCTCGECEKCTPEYVERHLNKDEASEESKKSKHSRGHYEGAAHAIAHAIKDKHDASELAEHMKKHMKKIYGDDFDEKKAEHAIKKVTSSKAKSEDGNEWDDEERRGDANGRWSDKQTGRSHRDDQGSDDEY